MKKLGLTLILAFVSFMAYSQFYLPNKTTFGFKGGLNLADVQQTQKGTSGSYFMGSLVTYSAGVYADVVLGQSFSIQPGLYYTNKGYDFNGRYIYASGYIERAHQQIKVSYIQGPLYFLYHILTPSGKLFMGAGPYGAYALKAREKSRYQPDNDADVTPDNTTVIDQELELGAANSVRHLDYGVTGLAGYRFNKGWLITANYDWGLANITPVSTNVAKTHTRTAGISVGFAF
jgi:hypothetical protein